MANYNGQSDRYSNITDKLASWDSGEGQAPAYTPVVPSPVKTEFGAHTITPQPNAGDLAGPAAAMAVNPYLGGAALGLTALGMISQSNQAQRELEYQAKLQKISSIQNALGNLAQTSAGLSRI